MPTVQVEFTGTDHISNVVSGIADGFDTVEKALGYAKQAFDATVGATVAYADEVRALQQVTGASAEETSRLIQVLDDYKVSTTDAMAAQRALTKQGIVLTTDALAELSAAYLEQSSQADKNAYAQKMLGRNYKAFIEVLQQGPDAIREGAAAVSENMILTEKTMKLTREYQAALDALGDSATGLAYAMGQALLPTTVELSNALAKGAEGWAQFFAGMNAYNAETARAEEILNKQGLSINAVSVSAADAGRQMAQGLTPATDAQVYAARVLAQEQFALEKATQGTSAAQSDAEQDALDLAAAQKVVEDQLRATTAANNGLLSLTMSIQGENNSYHKSMIDLEVKAGELNTALQTLKKQGWRDTSQAVIDATKAIDDNAQAMAELASSHEQAMKKIAYDLYVAKLQADGFTDAEFEMAIQAGVTAGIIDQSTARMALGMDAAAKKAIETGAAFYTAAEQARALAGEYVVSIKTIYSSADYGMDSAPAGDVMHGHATGGSFMIPRRYGHEGARMGNNSASGGERVTITPGGGETDYSALSRAIVQAIQQSGMVR